jgi:4'-phosphopantetheinyl transferase EntD
MLEELLPARVVAVEAFGDSLDAELLPGEEAAVARAVESRRREFTTARGCARAALAKLGEPPVPIPRGPKGAPVWPAGIVGSITHCAGYRAAAVARDSDVATLGLDAEPHDRLPDGVLKVIARDEERAHVQDLAAAAPAVCWDRLLFSAKESVYKAWFPVTRRWLDFEAADVRIDPEAGTFTARLLEPAPEAADVPLSVLNGRWMTGHGLVLTAIVVARP